MISLTRDAQSVEAAIAHARRDVEPGVLSPKDVFADEAFESRVVRLTDARLGAAELELDVDGFVLRQVPTTITDFFDLDSVTGSYVPETVQLVRELTGTGPVVVLEHVIRGPLKLAEQHPEYGRHTLGWALKAHIDADEETFRTWASHVAGDDELAARCRAEPFAVYNVWRPITPVEQKPLGFCHAASVRRDDLIPARYDGRFSGMIESEYYPAVDYFHLAFHPDQRWYYFADMQPDEVAVFKQWDTDPARAHCVPHSAFEDPTSRPGAVRRISIEVRVFALRDT